MNFSVKNNLISLLVAFGIFVIGAGIFIAFVNSDVATESDIDTSSKANGSAKEAKYYTLSDGRILESQGKVESNVTENFKDIIVSGTIRDDVGVLDFTMENANIRAKYRESSDENNNKEYFSYNEQTFDTTKKYRADGDMGQDEMFQGYVYYNGDEDKELCTYIKSGSYFEMVSCEDEKNVYTTMKTSSLIKSNSVSSIKNNSLYKFDKSTHQTKKLCDLNIHEDEKYIYDVACNEKNIYVLFSKNEELYVKVFDKETYQEKKEASVEEKDNIEEFAAKKVKEYKVREISNYEILNEGYDLFASDNGLVIVNRQVVAEIESTSNKHYGEKGYTAAFDEKGLEPYVMDLYKVSSFTIDGSDVTYDSAYVCESDFMFDFAYFKNGVIYILTFEKDVNANIIEKIRVTAVKKGTLLDQIYINLNKVSDTTGKKELKYIGIE